MPRPSSACRVTWPPQAAETRLSLISVSGTPRSVTSAALTASASSWVSAEVRTVYVASGPLPTFCALVTVVSSGTAAESIARCTAACASACEPISAGRMICVPPENSMPSSKPRTTKLPMAISTRTAAMANQRLRRPTMLRFASPR